jgi:S1-C subfamily serine protease
MTKTRSCRRLPFLAIFALAIPLVCFARTAFGEAKEEGKNALIYEKAKRAVVEVLVNGHLNGTGWFVDPRGMLFTAAHVIERPDRQVEIVSEGIGRIPAEIVAVDLLHDLALLRVAEREKPYPSLELAGKTPPPGEEVFLFGSPIYRHRVFIRGSMARDDATFEYYEDRYNEMTHVSATVAIGMSGGPWLDSDGRVAGLNSGVMAINGLPVGVCFSSPLPALRALLKSRVSAVTPHLGAALEELWQQDAKTIERFPPKTEGLLLVILQKDGPAEKAGLKQAEMIVAIDGVKVRLIDELLAAIMKKTPGETVELSVLDADGSVRKVAVTLGKLECK